MSLVGTRPPTVDEWEQYELHHRSRMSTKPGIADRVLEITGAYGNSDSYDASREHQKAKSCIMRILSR